jgi:hypothetical protein
MTSNKLRTYTREEVAKVGVCGTASGPDSLMSQFAA